MIHKEDGGEYLFYGTFGMVGKHRDKYYRCDRCGKIIQVVGGETI